MPGINTGQFKKGERRNPATEFRPGQAPWNKGVAYTKISGENHPFWKGGKPNCLDCGKKLGTYKTKRCSPCHLKSPKALAHLQEIATARDMSGDKHPNWQGGKTGERRLLMNHIPYKDWRKAVFERDNYTCQFCGQYGGVLHADHIEKWSDNETLRYVVSNGRTLCVSCHYYVTFKRKIPIGALWCNSRVARKRG